MSLILAFIGFALLAVVAILDKFILTKSIPKPIVFVFYSSVFVLPILLLLPFGVVFLQTWFDWLIAVISGAAFAFALWAMYTSYIKSEISHAGPLVGAATPFFVLILSLSFLNENLTKLQLVGIFVLIFGSLLISSEKSRKHTGWHTGMLWGVLAGLFYATSNVSAKYIYDIYGFYSGFVWVYGFLGLSGLFLLFSPSVRSIFKKSASKTVKSKQRISKQIILVSINKILGVIALVLIQFAVAIGSVALVSALSGVQFAVLIILVALLSKFAPKLFKEQYGKRELVWELVAVGVIVFGLVLVVI